jgi:hypothetical protein
MRTTPINIFNILKNSYLAAAKVTASTPAKPVKYVNVDGRDYQGTWKGKFSDGQGFSVTISNITGYRAEVRLQLGHSVTNAFVLIGDSSFRIGDSKFILGKDGTATLATAVTNPIGGTISVKHATATRI